LRTKRKGRPLCRPLSFLRRSSVIQHPPKLLFLTWRERRGARSLGLQQGSEKDTIVHLGTDGAQVTMVRLVSHVLSLKNLGFSLTAALAPQLILRLLALRALYRLWAAEHKRPISQEE
jgi:hypothetical protein